MTTTNKLSKEIELTAKGYPALWESGGGMSNTGKATIICGKNGEKKRSVYVRRKGHLSNGNHALVIVEIGDFVITSKHHRGDFEINVYKIKDIIKDERIAELELVYEFYNNEWQTDIPEYLKEAVKASMDKATDYHCRDPYYVVEPSNSPV